jgi:hypothetical protein
MPPLPQAGTKPDYAKWSLYLGAVSIIGAGFYWLWQIESAEEERRFRKKYEEAKKAIQEVQRVYGLMPTGRLDEPTKDLFMRLATERGIAGEEQGHAL